MCKYFVNCLSESRIFADETDVADFLSMEGGCLNQDLWIDRIGNRGVFAWVFLLKTPPTREMPKTLHVRFQACAKETCNLRG